MGKEPGKQPKQLVDAEWSNALTGMARHIQTNAGVAAQLQKRIQDFANSPAAQVIKQLGAFAETEAGKFMKLAHDFANSPAGKQWAETAKHIIAANERAKQLSDLIHSAADIEEIQRAIENEPIDAYTLLALVTLERDQEAGELEKRFQENSQAARSERGRMLAKQAHAKSPHARVKPEIIGFYEKHAAEIKADGRPRFKTKASFVREVSNQYGHTVTDPDTIAKWVAESAVKVPHWRPRSAPKKT